MMFLAVSGAALTEHADTHGKVIRLRFGPPSLKKPQERLELPTWTSTVCRMVDFSALFVEDLGLSCHVLLRSRWSHCAPLLLSGPSPPRAGRPSDVLQRSRRSSLANHAIQQQEGRRYGRLNVEAK